MNCKTCGLSIGINDVIICVPSEVQMRSSRDSPQVWLTIETFADRSIFYHHDCFVAVAGEEHDPLLLK